MLLLIDAGNTRVKWAIADKAAPIGSWRASGALFHTELDLLSEPLKQYPPKRALLSNVAGEVMRARLEQFLLDSGQN
jgi:type III pantothenate kinase